MQLANLFGLEDLLQHTDGMRAACHNYFLHLDGDGRLTFLPWSVDLTLLPGFGEDGPLGTCSAVAQLCERDERCREWFLRARDEAAQLVLRGDFRARAAALAERLAPYAWPGDASRASCAAPSEGAGRRRAATG